MELVDILVLETSAERRAGSNPAGGKTSPFPGWNTPAGVSFSLSLRERERPTQSHQGWTAKAVPPRKGGCH